MTVCIIHDALRESDKVFRCHNKDTAFGDKPRGKVISRFFSFRHRDSLINSVPGPGLNPSVLRFRLVVFTAKWYRGKQTAPKHNVRFNLLSVPVVTYIFNIISEIVFA